MEEQKCACGENCQCGCRCRRSPKFILILVGIILLAAIIIISILRDRIVNSKSNQVTVYGEGKVTYAPDEATITLGMEVDNVSSAGAAASQLNDKMTKIISAETALGLDKNNIKTESYNLSPQYNYNNGAQTISGYSASEHLVIKVQDVQNNQDLPGKVISTANDAGANQILGVSYDVSNPNDYRQKARLAAIKDAENKAADLFQAAGMKPGKIIGWFENNVMTPQPLPYVSSSAMTAAAAPEKSIAPAPVPIGTEDTVVDIGVSYEVK